MSKNPQKTNKDSKETAEESIEQSIANDQDTESIEVTGEGEAKGTAAAGLVYNLITFCDDSYI